MNIYPAGQCTWWCADQEPWCMRYGNLGNAMDWGGNWGAHGGFVSPSPAVGSVVCFQPGVDTAKALGHVAVVLTIAAGSFTVSEMDAPIPFQVRRGRVCIVRPGVSFLYDNAPTPTGDEMPPMYQRTNGSTYLVLGDTLLTLGDPADIQYHLSLGSKIILESKISAAEAAGWNKLPVI